ncbi:unnamed protein product [Rhizoctonia solani]|uniref:DNA 3'-5' helicase n=1 Tax=Rhizoctonia solani TaxID=456999 RepID=A0A8H3E1W8_9AGAM|nr:unnamed protein product [Rhizoctonia solani]
MLRHLELNRMRKCVISRTSRYFSQNHLEGLNLQQRQAVTFPPNTSLQMLAGPGTGKTQVLTARVAELVKNHSYSPSSICAVTFTRRAAGEMKERLNGYLGVGNTEELKLGTFHSVCAHYLRTYGTMVHVNPNFLIWNEEECALLIKYIAASLQNGFIKGFPATEVYEMFSTVKERAKTNPDKSIEMILKEELEYSPLDNLRLMPELFHAYSQVLRISSALDYTDILCKGLDLFRAAPWAQEVAQLKHVLVDEFQDTSALQYLIIKELFKATDGSISVVGDPDQSIYGWRGAVGTVFKQMERDLPQTKAIYLEENYRSSASNITTAINIISQDKTRPLKTLFTSRTPDGPKPLKKGFSISAEETAFIGQEINRLIVKSNGLISYGDCAILFRTNYPMADFSKMLRDAGIPSRQLPESSLYDRSEVKNLLAFLQLAMNDAHTPMLIQLMQGPLGLEGKTLDAENKVIMDLIGRSIKHGLTLFDTWERLRNGLDTDTTPSSIAAATLLSQVLVHLRSLIKSGASPVELIYYIIKSADYHQYLKTKGPEKGHSWRVDNVKQTIQYARQFRGGEGSSMMSVIALLEFMRNLSSINNLNTGEVTLLTCHTAKGLEWPVVFVPDVVDGVYPHLKSDDVDEERRLLYVACTRAKCLLYLTYPEKKLVGRGGNKAELPRDESDFIKDMPQLLYQDKAPSLNKEALKLFSNILGRGSREKI